MSNGEPASTAVTTPFRRRLSAVWLTYRTRPMTWLLSLIYIVAVVGIAVKLHESRPPFETWIELAGNQDASQFRTQRSTWDTQHRLAVTPRSYAPLPQLEMASPEMQRAFYHHKPVLPKEAKTIAIYSEADIPEEFWDGVTYPHVETVISYAEPLSSDTLQKLLTTHRLKALYLNRCEKMTADDLRVLAESDSLQFLSLEQIRPLSEASPLQWPRNLRQLKLSTFMPLPVQRFQEWRTLQHLDALVLALPAKDQPTLYAPEIVAELEQFPRRPTLFLDIPEGSAGEWAVAAQPHFHRLPVRPKNVPRLRTTAALYAWFVLMLPMGFGTIQLAGQSLQTLVALAPGARRPHQMMTAMVWICGGMIAAGFSMSHGVAWWAALALGGSGALLYSLLGLLMRQNPGIGQVAWVNPFMAFLPIIFIPATSMTVMFLFNFFPLFAGEVDWFLRGRYPWLSGAMIVVGLVCGKRLLRQMSMIRRSAEEAGMTQVPLSAIDLAGWNRAATPLATRNLDRKLRWNPIMRSREQRLENVLNRGPALTRSQRIAVWMCGLLLHPLDFTRVFVLIVIMQFGAFLVMRECGLDMTVNRSIMFAGAFQMLAMFLFIPFGILWSRRRWMAHELLFPLSRQDWIRDWFITQMWMFSPILILLATLAGIDTVLGGVVRPTSTEACIAAVVLIYLVVAAWGLSLRVATWTAWQCTQFLIAVTGGLFGLSFVFLALAWITGDNTSSADAVIASPWTAVVGIVSALAGLVTLIGSTYRVWQTWEVGRLN